VSEISKEHRAAMAADLFERAAKMLRGGDMAGGRLAAGEAFEILTSAQPETHYKIALGFFDVFGADANAAVAAILDGRHPATSLPGQVTKMRFDAKADYDGMRSAEVSGMAYCNGETHALANVLTLLGCKVSAAPTEQIECKTCKRPADAVNHVTGCIFVGYGIGWQTCPDCNGTCKVAASEASHPRACRGDLCSACGRCLWCYLCKCPGAPVHPDDVPAVGSLPSDALAGVP
jgi:hypothetical protein